MNIPNPSFLKPVVGTLYKRDRHGRFMRKMVAKRGRNTGNTFWSCTKYPDCNGTRNV